MYCTYVFDCIIIGKIELQIIHGRRIAQTKAFVVGSAAHLASFAFPVMFITFPYALR